MYKVRTQSIIKPLVEAPPSQWMVFTNRPDRTDRLTVWGSTEFTVQVFRVKDGIIRLAINRTEISRDERVFTDGISWESLMEIKSQVGYGDRQAVEIYPEDRNVVNKINVRHLWILAQPLDFAWKVQDNGNITNFLDQ